MRFIICLALLWNIQHVLAQNKYSQEISFQNDNDVYLFINQDRYYTNGVLFHYRQALGSPEHKQLLTLSLGQQIYNGVENSSWHEIPWDMPFTGYLFASAAWSRYTTDAIFTAGIELGQVGNHALGQAAQEFIHNTFSFYKVAGWDHRLQNAFGVDLKGRYQQVLTQGASAQKVELSMDIQANLGMNHTDIQFSLPLRYGRLKSFRDSYFTKGHLQQGKIENPREFYVLYKPSIKAQFYNSTVQGGLFRDDPIGRLYRLKPLVLAHDIGFEWNRKRWATSVIYHFESRTIRDMLHRHQYAQLVLSYSF